jgi:hypothetical protein
LNFSAAYAAAGFTPEADKSALLQQAPENYPVKEWTFQIILGGYDFP